MGELPAYQAIKDHILARIDSGEWGEGSLIPSENELARQFNVARMTVNRALRELTDAQVLTRTKGAGTYVAPPKYQSTLVEIRSIAEEIRARGHRHSAVVLTLESIKAMGSGRSIQVVKYFFQIRRGWRHLGFLAMTSPGQYT